MLRFWTAPSAFVPIFISFLLASGECRGQAAATPETLSSLTLSADTPVKLRLKRSLYDKEAKPGRSLLFEVVENVVVNGQVVIQEGTAVTGSIRQVDRTGEGPAKLLLDLGPTQTITGETVRLVGPGATTGAAKDRYKMKDAGGLVAAEPEVIPVLPVFVAMTLFQRKKALLSVGMREMAYVGEKVALDPAKLQAAQSSVTKPGYATVFFLEPNEFLPILCGPVQHGLRESLAVRLRPGHYLCRQKLGNATAFEFEVGKEYYVNAGGALSLKSGKLEDRNLLRSGTLEEWNLLNEEHGLDNKVVDVTLPGHTLDLAPYRKEVEKHPQSSGAHLALASYLHEVSELEESQKEYLQALALGPDSREAHLGLARLYQEKGDCAHAIAEYRSGMKNKLRDEFAHEEFVRFLEDCNDLDAALAEAKEALQTWPDKAWLHYLLGQLLVKEKDADAGIIELRWAITKEKHFPLANCELGRAFELKGDLEAALDQYRTAFQADMGDKECRAAFERLRQQLKK